MQARFVERTEFKIRERYIITWKTYNTPHIEVCGGTGVVVLHARWAIMTSIVDVVYLSADGSREGAADSYYPEASGSKAWRR